MIDPINSIAPFSNKTKHGENRMVDFTGFLDVDYIDAQYRKWKQNPNAVARDWQFFFQGFELAASRPSESSEETGRVDRNQILLQSRVEALIYRFRDIGHLLACLDPLSACPTNHPLLDPAAVQISEKDLEKPVLIEGLNGSEPTAVREIIRIFRETYCHGVGVEYMHLQDPQERRWLQDRMEPNRNRPDVDEPTQIQILEKLYQANLFEQFLHKKYLGQTRFSLEGAESVIPMMDLLLQKAGEQGVREIILGMAHRGRLNVQTHILGKPYEDIFGEFESCYDPEELVGAGDVKYHNGYLADIQTQNGYPLRAFLVNNPSHLESVNPVVEGFARARQDISGNGSPGSILPVLIHGDAAFSGQGIVAETLNLSQLKGYSTQGTIHIVINNQIGYTTLPEDARSTRYATDVAKMLMIPIFHVHGEDPESVAHFARLACEYRMAFGKDVVIDVVCYRRYGHNEGDEPYFTQPQMYRRIKDRLPVNRMYADKLIHEGRVDPKEIERIENGINESLNYAYESIHGTACSFPEPRFYENWEGLYGRYTQEPVETGLGEKHLKALARKLNRLPDEFTPHPKLERILKTRMEAVEKGEGIDWANAEALSFASLLSEGIPIRLSGQDVGRGTFSQRHSVLTDAETGTRYIPLNALGEKQATFSVYDSMLSETGVLGFEYGYSLGQPRGLIMWEAQFGDFANNAQPVIDLYIASGESKWQRPCGLVLLLPHGYEGLGPEHSSARPERFLQLCADNNMQVCNATTPAQYFHLLRRQMKRDFRKPLVIMTPKSLLRHPRAVSKLSDLTSGTFNAVLDDPEKLKTPQRMLMCSGKIFYDLLERRQQLKAYDIGIIRIEQLYPIAHRQLEGLQKKYRKADAWIWVQEEPENMGAWRFLQPEFEGLFKKPFHFIGRKAAASPATGFPAIYKMEKADILDRAVGPLPDK